MAKIDLGDIWTVGYHAVFKPGVGKVATVPIIRKKHNRLAMTEKAIARRNKFKEAARKCAGKPIGEFLRCMETEAKG